MNKAFASTLIVYALTVSPAVAQSIASATASTGTNDYQPMHAVDNNWETRWSSEFSDNHWLEIKFDEPCDVVGLRLHWETAYGRDYNIDVLEISNDQSKWASAAQVRDSDGGLDEIYFGQRRIAGFRLTGIRRGTGWGYSLWEVETLGLEYKRETTASSESPDTHASHIVDGDLTTCWSPEKGDQSPTISISCKKKLNLGGLRLNWKSVNTPPCTVEALKEDTSWEKIADKPANGPVSEDLFFNAVETHAIRLVFDKASDQQTIQLLEVGFKGPNEAWNPVRHFEMLAQRNPDGLYPGWLKRSQTYWTVCGLPGTNPAGMDELLLDEDGRVESGLKSFSVSPCLLVDGQILGPREFDVSQSLLSDWAPTPSVEWTGHDLTFNISAVATESGLPMVSYKMTNHADSKRDVSMLLALRPLPINPPWQHGGFSAINELRWLNNDQSLIVNGKQALTMTPAPDNVLLKANSESNIQSALTVDDLEAPDHVVYSETGVAVAGIRYDFHLEADESSTVIGVYPVKQTQSPQRALSLDSAKSDADRDALFQKHIDRSLELWSSWTGDWSIELSDNRIAQMLRSNLAYLLINADGPAVQPGSRNYNHSWIRDGAISATAMLRFNLKEQVTAYLNWFNSLIPPDGNIPFLVETTTGDTVWFARNWTEHDAFGEYIFLLRQYVELLDDDEMARTCLPYITAALGYMDALRNERLTSEYTGTEYEGILPDSNSHEGYFPGKHSYWDDFWALKGLQDAQALALRLNKPQLAAQWKEQEEKLRTSLMKSIDLVRQRDGLATLPACAELGDFDPTSTSIAIMAADERNTLNAEALKATYDSYMSGCRARADQPPHERRQYTPYEVRNISALLRLGQDDPSRIDEARWLLDYFIEDATRPAAWNHMAEVVHGDPRTPSYIGDMPHTWVGSGLINAIRDFFVYEDRGALVLAAGIKDDWMDDSQGVAVKNLPTWWGPISYTLTRQPNGHKVLKLSIKQQPPAGIIVPEGVELQITKP